MPIEPTAPYSIRARRALVRHLNSFVDSDSPQVRQRAKQLNAQTVRGMSIENVEAALRDYNINLER